MTASSPATVLIIGAGSMGVITGYHLSLAGAKITFLVRPHRLEPLSKPQLLYCFDDNELKRYSGYDILTSPDALAGTSFDFVIITLDGNALRSPDGVKMVEAVGREFSGKGTIVVLGSIGIDLRNWFIAQSHIEADHVVNAGLGILAYEAQRLKMPLQDGVDADALAKADYGYRHSHLGGYFVTTTPAAACDAFVGLYDRNSAGSKCVKVERDQIAVFCTPIFAQLAAFGLLGWPSSLEIEASNPTWQLAAEAVREIQALSIHGEVGKKTAAATTPEGLLEAWRKSELDTRPLNYQVFNQYHHGGKVVGQDHDILREALGIGAKEGASMPALTKLVSQLS